MIDTENSNDMDLFSALEGFINLVFVIVFVM